MEPVAAWLGGVRVVLVTERDRMGDGSVVAYGAAVARAVAALPLGAALVLVREPDLDGGQVLPLVHAAMASGAAVMVSDRLDVAFAAGAAGVLLPANGLAIADARKLAPAGFLVGATRRALPGPVDTSRLGDAVNQYLQMVRAAPADVRVWLKIADLYAKVGATEDAIHAYLRVGASYREHGFWLEAIAVYKRTLELDATDSEARPALAELYRLVGLESEARLVEQAELGDAPGPARSPLSVHGADLVLVGPIFDTPGAGAPLGPDALRAARASLASRPSVRPLHLVAVGGVSDPARAAACCAAGADAVAVDATAWTGDLAAFA